MQVKMKLVLKPKLIRGKQIFDIILWRQLRREIAPTKYGGLSQYSIPVHHAIRKEYKRRGWNEYPNENIDAMVKQDIGPTFGW